MKYAQIKKGKKLHLVYEPGEGVDVAHLVPKGSLSSPLCHTKYFAGSYVMTINVPLANACKNCVRAYKKVNNG